MHVTSLPCLTKTGILNLQPSRVCLTLTHQHQNLTSCSYLSSQRLQCICTNATNAILTLLSLQTTLTRDIKNKTKTKMIDEHLETEQTRPALAKRVDNERSKEETDCYTDSNLHN